MAEDKQVRPEGKPQSTSGDLVAKIAQAYGTIPQEERDKTLLYPSETEVQNPELDQTFDKLVETYSRRAPDKARTNVHIFPGSAAPQLSPAEPGEQAGALVVARPRPNAHPKSYECAECGHVNPGENRFCGMCGALYEEAGALELSQAPVTPQHETSVTAAGIQHHHHYYHHHEGKQNWYLIALVVVLLIFIGWQQWATVRARWYPSPGPAATVPAGGGVVAVDQGLAMPAMTVITPPTAASSATAPPAPNATVNPSKPAVAAASFRAPAPAPAVEPAASQPPPETSANGGGEAPPLSLLRDQLERLVLPPVPMPKAQMPTGPEVPRISQGVVQGDLIRRVSPIYPPLAAKANIEGNVVVNAKIARDGSVTDVKAISGHPMLRAAAVDAVKQWKYKPSLVSGQPVEVETTITIAFQRFAKR